jgi:hypothetical protein
LSGHNVINLQTGEKLGGITLKANAIGVIILAGFVMIGSSIFLFFKNYEESVAKAKQQNESLQQMLIDLKSFDQRLNLIFPDKDPPSPWNAVCHAFVLKKNEAQEQPHEVHLERGGGGIVVTISALSLGDVIHVEVEEAGRKWRSDDTPFGAAQLPMRVQP